MYIQVRDRDGTERFLEEENLESAISLGEVVAFRRSDGWITVPFESFRGEEKAVKTQYTGQERRRRLLSRVKIIQKPDGN